MNKKFYVTTAIDYPNAEPHIGHAYQKIIADVLARWNRLNGKDVWFLTGTDEHGKKIENAAGKSGKTPKEFVDEVSEKFKESWKSLNLTPDRFIRTTDKDHEKLVQAVLKKCIAKGDVYLGEYEGFYCTDCEADYTEKDLEDGCCPVHKRPIEKLREKSYFFRLSKYQKFLLDLYKKNPEFILPSERKNEIVNRVNVWFDALFNYISGAGKNGKYWPADLHLLGKDNSWFHCVYWPAFLKSAGYEFPKTIFVHGFLTFNGQKISKSLGNVISPKVLAEKYGADTIRYFVCRQFPFASGDDGDFSEQALIDRHNNELANKLGNLVSRVSGLIERNGIEKTENKLLKKLDTKKIEKYFDNFEFDKILNEIFGFIDVCNEYVQNRKIWESKNKKDLYELKESILEIAKYLSPFIPSTSDKIEKQFSAKEIKKSEILFQKI